MRRAAVILLLVLAGCAAPQPAGVPDACAGGRVTGTGSTAQAAAVNAWIRDYQVACADATIAYESTGSSAGVRAFLAGKADFAGTDAPLGEADRARAEERCGGEVLHLPLVAGAVAVVHNVAGVRDLNLSPGTLAGIFAGRVKRWNDAAIAAENPDVALPATPIRTVHRSDSSGTTATFTRFLARAAPDRWDRGAGSTWPGGGGSPGEGGSPVANGSSSAAGGGSLPQRGSYRVAAAVARTDGAIGYVEASYARFHDLPAAWIAAGDRYVAPDDHATALAVAGAEVDDELRLSFGTTSGYPIVSVTYELVCRTGAPELVRGFLAYAAGPAGQEAAGRCGYAPLPAMLRDRVVAAVNLLG